MPLFGSSKKSPAEMVKITMDAQEVLQKESPGSKKAEKVRLLTISKVCEVKLFI